MRTIFIVALLFVLSQSGAADAQGFRMPCHVDTLCAGVESGGGRIMNCLRAHKTELSEQCLAAIGRSVMNWGSRAQPGSGPMQGEGQGGPDGAGGPDRPRGQGQATH
jgi:hypothetical protein